MKEIIAASAQELAASFTPKQRKIALAIVAIAFFMDLLDATIVNIAIPAIQDDIGASYAAIQWLIAGYALTFAVLLITGGRMGDVFGYRKIFMVGIGGFTLASLLSGVATNPEMLVASRLVQGAMAALMVPQVIALMQIMYKPEERGLVNGLFGALGGIAGALGPVIGGLLLEANLFDWGWRTIFLINVPLGIFGLFAAIHFLPKGKSPHPLKLDIQGTAMIMAAIILLIFPLIQGRELDWPLWCFAMMAASAPMFGLFMWWQTRKHKKGDTPLILPSLFKKRSFSTGLVVNIIYTAAIMGFSLTSMLVLQIGLGFDALEAALTGLPAAIGVAMTVGVLGKILPKLGRKAIFIGLAVMSLGLGITAWVPYQFGIDVTGWHFLPGLLFMGVGMGFIFGSLMAAVLNNVDPRDAGSASGTLQAVQQVGGAIGVAIFGLIFFGQLTQAAPSSFTTVEPELRQSLGAQHVPVEAQTSIVNGLKTCFIDQAREKDPTVVPESCKQTDVPPAPTAITQVVRDSARHAAFVNFRDAFRWVITFEVALLVVTAFVALLLPRHFRPEAYETSL